MTTTHAPTLTVETVLAELEALGNEAVLERNRKNGAGVNQFGVKLGNIRNVAKPIKTNHALALELWATGNIDARLLAILIMKPNALSAKEMDTMVRSATFVQVADRLNASVVKNHSDKEALHRQWTTAADPMGARAGWNLTAGQCRIAGVATPLIILDLF